MFALGSARRGLHDTQERSWLPQSERCCNIPFRVDNDKQCSVHMVGTSTVRLPERFPDVNFRVQ